MWLVSRRMKRRMKRYIGQTMEAELKDSGLIEKYDTYKVDTLTFNSWSVDVDLGPDSIFHKLIDNADN